MDPWIFSGKPADSSSENYMFDVLSEQVQTFIYFI